MSEIDEAIVPRRSEIVFFYDARDANPNGNPLSSADRPRIDPQTQQAIVTDVRLKRYIRDQLEADGHGVYVQNVMEEGTQATREDLFLDRLEEEWGEELKNLDLDDYEDEEALADAVYETFVEKAADVRYFGATMSVDIDGDIGDVVPDHYTGPVQFSPGKTLHPVQINEEYNSLTSVIATGEDKEQGGFDLADHRIKYGLIGFHGLVDEHAAEDTLLTEEDVERLDTLIWRAIKNQTTTRSKKGQEPRLYLRIEYEEEGWHLGGLDRDIELDDESKPHDEVRTIRDVVLDISTLRERLDRHSDRIHQIHLSASDVVTFTDGDEVGGDSVLVSALEDAVGRDKIRTVDVYEKHVEAKR